QMQTDALGNVTGFVQQSDPSMAVPSNDAKPADPFSGTPQMENGGVCTTCSPGTQPEGSQSPQGPEQPQTPTPGTPGGESETPAKGSSDVIEANNGTPSGGDSPVSTASTQLPESNNGGDLGDVSPIQVADNGGGGGGGGDEGGGGGGGGGGFSEAAS